MKLAAHSGDAWSFQLSPHEAALLRGLLTKYPVGPAAPARISQSDPDPAAERQKLLEESLAEHRRDLERLARDLLAEDKWRPAPPGPLLTLTSESREILLQILNDIRLGCWHALGEPDDLEHPMPPQPISAHRVLMDLAGYFEMNLLDPDLLA